MEQRTHYRLFLIEIIIVLLLLAFLINLLLNNIKDDQNENDTTLTSPMMSKTRMEPDDDPTTPLSSSSSLQTTSQTSPSIPSSTSTRPEMTTTSYSCFYEGYWCSDWDWQNVETIYDVKDQFVCQTLCQLSDVYPCEFFAWDSMGYSCTMSRHCEKIYLGYLISGPKFCDKVA